jgi:ABC-type transport system involved in cytochrome c biogenesis permease subunit
MLVHFGQAIVRFIYRREDEARRELDAVGGDTSLSRRRRLTLAEWRRPAVWAPAILTAVFGVYVLRAATPAKDKFGEAKIHEFAMLPVAYGGRLQPMDTLATNTLRVISRKATYEDERFEKKQPAIRWLLDVAAQNPAYLKHKVIRIDNLDVLKLVKLPRRDGFLYSISELLPQAEELEKQVKLAREVPEDKQNLMQKKVLELDARTRTIMVLMDSFAQPDIRGETREAILSSFQSLMGRIAALNQSAPRPVPPADENDTWKTLMEAEKDALLASLDPEKKAKANEAATMLRAMLTAYREDKPQEFNAQLAGYEKLVTERSVAEAEHEQLLADDGKTSGRKPAERMALGRLAFEAWFNHFDPFVLCIALYVVAFVLASLAWLGWTEGFNRAANWLLWLTFALHTFGLVCRIYISGRPPITNLYSSALFIGWAAVLFALVFEAIYRLGVGNLLAAVIGFPTMVIAYYLAFDGTGDTIGVMQAVLDTNFWLATHVVCITLGYSTTLLAGALGAISILLGYVGGRLNADQHRQLTRMTYGTLCFAIFFSFIGTVLGGLWADDSWGRFWGWDPKENGALMIVIWNAIVLHARWGKMIGDRGLASLAVLGNVVTTWSWFGVNEMGVGLHAYGFTEGRAFKLGLFMASQLIVAALAWVGTRRASAPRMPASAAMA